MCERYFNWFFEKMGEIDVSSLDTYSLFDYPDKTEWSLTK
jgi:hypothetical protein